MFTRALEVLLIKIANSVHVFHPNYPTAWQIIVISITAFDLT